MDSSDAALAAALRAEADALEAQAKAKRQQAAALSRPSRGVQVGALLSREQMARLWGVSLATLDRLRSEGLPQIRVLGSPRFDPAQALEWLKRNSE